MTSDGVWFSVRYKVTGWMASEYSESGPFFSREETDREIVSLARLDEVYQLEILQHDPEHVHGIPLQPVIC